MWLLTICNSSGGAISAPLPASTLLEDWNIKRSHGWGGGRGRYPGPKCEPDDSTFPLSNLINTWCNAYHPFLNMFSNLTPSASMAVRWERVKSAVRVWIQFRFIMAFNFRSLDTLTAFDDESRFVILNYWDLQFLTVINAECIISWRDFDLDLTLNSNLQFDLSHAYPVTIWYIVQRE